MFSDSPAPLRCGLGGSERQEAAMATEDSKTGEAERQRLIAVRQAWVEALAGEYQRGRTKAAVDRIVTIQRAIEAVTAALQEVNDPAGMRKARKASDEDVKGGGSPDGS
jgi:hypothetical protein